MTDALLVLLINLQGRRSGLKYAGVMSPGLKTRDVACPNNSTDGGAWDKVGGIIPEFVFGYMQIFLHSRHFSHIPVRVRIW